MRLRINKGTSDTNFHGPEHSTIRGWKMRVADLLKANPCGANVKWYKRIIMYFPSGAWWHIDIAVLKGEKK